MAQGWQRVGGLRHARGAAARSGAGGRMTPLEEVTQSIFPILAISSSQILVSSSISRFWRRHKRGGVNLGKVGAGGNGTKKRHKRSVRYLLLQSLFQRVVLHLLLPQAGRQCRAVWIGLRTHLCDVLVGPAGRATSNPSWALKGKIFCLPDPTFPLRHHHHHHVLV